jgi:hypothetical protein
MRGILCWKEWLLAFEVTTLEKGGARTENCMHRQVTQLFAAWDDGSWRINI